jgi:hypothetical protein
LPVLPRRPTRCCLMQWTGSSTTWRTASSCQIVGCVPPPSRPTSRMSGLRRRSDNAGSFATADELGRRGQMWLPAGPLARQSMISPASTRRATVNRWPQREPARGLGWVVMESTAPVRDGDAAARGGFHPPTESPCAPRFSGELLSPHAFGQTGFTGTSLWVDPAGYLVAVPAAAQPARRVLGRGRVPMTTSGGDIFSPRLTTVARALTTERPGQKVRRVRLKPQFIHRDSCGCDARAHGRLASPELARSTAAMATAGEGRLMRVRSSSRAAVHQRRAVRRRAPGPELRGPRDAGWEPCHL